MRQEAREKRNAKARAKRLAAKQPRIETVISVMESTRSTEEEWSESEDSDEDCESDGDVYSAAPGSAIAAPERPRLVIRLPAPQPSSQVSTTSVSERIFSTQHMSDMPVQLRHDADRHMST